MLLIDAQTKTEELLLKHGLAKWKFRYQKRLKNIRRYGCCHYRTKTISLAPTFVEKNNEDVVVNVILHEIAHALFIPWKNRITGQWINCGHKSQWKKKALEIGCDGERFVNKNVIR